MTFKEQWLILFSTPLYAIVIGLEILLSHLHFKKAYTVKETLTNVYFTFINAGIDLFIRGFYLVVLIWFYEHRLIDNWQTAIAYWITLFFLEDFAYYWEHRIDHYCRLFWAVHVTHHSSPEFNLTTGFRSSVLQPLYRFIYFIPIAWIGFKPLDILFMYAITQVFGILVHTQYIQKMPKWFERFFVSPSHHRVHHASNIKYLDKNMGMVLIIWDKLFGTFEEEDPNEPIIYGLTKPIEKPNHPVKSITHEWENILLDLKKPIPFSTKMKYIFMPPGWSHDGSTFTAEELRMQLKSKRDI